MGQVESAIRSKVREGDMLETPVEAKPFYVGGIRGDGVVLELGEQRTPTHFSWECLEGVVPFLLQQGQLRINGSGKSTTIVRGTLDGYLKEHVNRLTAGWVAVLLEKAGVVQIDRRRPAKVGVSPQFRLKPGR
jgi:hypothetical protein